MSCFVERLLRPAAYPKSCIDYGGREIMLAGLAMSSRGMIFIDDRQSATIAARHDKVYSVLRLILTVFTNARMCKLDTESLNDDESKPPSFIGASRSPLCSSLNNRHLSALMKPRSERRCAAYVSYILATSTTGVRPLVWSSATQLFLVLGYQTAPSWQL